MRWTIAVAGLLCIAIATISFYLTSQGGVNDSSQTAIRQALRIQVKSVVADVEASLEGAERLLAEFFSEIEKNPTAAKMILERVEAPSFLLVKQDRRFRAFTKADFSVASNLKTAAVDHFNAKRPLAYWEDANQKPFVLWQGKSGDQHFVAAFSHDSLFFRLRSGGAIPPWVATVEGTVLYHSASRYIGANSANVRPVALGADSVRKGLKTEMLSQYVGMDGKEAIGAWTTLPEWGLIVGSEWPGMVGSQQAASPFTYGAWGGLFLGAFLMGLSLTSRRRRDEYPELAAEPASAEVSLEDSRKELSHEARGFIKRAEAAAQKAVEFAEQREAECRKLEDKAREKLAYVERTRWIFEKTEAFLDEVMEMPKEQGIWPLLAKNLSSMALDSPVMVLTYSPSTCTLTPQAAVNVNEFPESAQRYLENSRILIGDARNVAQLEQSEAFSVWRDKWARFMPIDDWNLFVLPFASPTGSKGVAMFLFDKEAISDDEIARQRELWHLFAYRAAWLYDMKRRLLQSRYGAQKSAQQLAHSPNVSRDQSQTSRA